MCACVCEGVCVKVSSRTRTCPGEAPSGDPGVVRTRTPLTASEIRWRRGGKDEPASHRSGWRSSSPQTPEGEEDRHYSPHRGTDTR